MSQSPGSERGRPDDAYPPPPSAPGSYPPPPGYPPPGYGQPGQPDSWGPPPTGRMSPSDERTWGMLSHLVALLVSLVTGLGVLVPLVVMLTKGKDSAFVRRHAVESLNFQITAILVAMIGGILAVIGIIATLGIGLFVVIPVAVAYGIFYLVMPILASVRANNGEDYRYPLTLRLVS